MDEGLRALIDQLDLEAIEVNLFRGRSASIGTSRVYGGQVIGQALVAAERTVEGRVPHSLHAYFLLPGDVAAPIVYQVDRVRDGRSFSARRVQAIQHGRPILSMIASFQIPEAGLEHAAAMPLVPSPESLIAQGTVAGGALRGVEFLPVVQVPPAQPAGAPPTAWWFRAAGRVGDDPRLHRWLLAYASDYPLMSAALKPHGRTWSDGTLKVASIDHALWFHRAARVDDWLLYTVDSPSSQGARGLTRGLIHDRGGTLVASVAQEGLMRDVGALRGQ